MYDNTNQSIFNTRKKILAFYHDKYCAFRQQYIDILDSLMAFTTSLNYTRITMEEMGQVRCKDDATTIFDLFDFDSATKLLDLVKLVNDTFDSMHTAYVSYFVKKKALGF